MLNVSLFLPIISVGSRDIEYFVHVALSPCHDTNINSLIW